MWRGQVKERRGVHRTAATASHGVACQGHSTLAVAAGPKGVAFVSGEAVARVRVVACPRRRDVDVATAQWWQQ